MIRVRPNRCGYSGYSCVGIGSEHSVFTTSKLIKDDPGSYATVPSDTAQNLLEGWSKIDNYLNLPVKVKGSITTADELFDMQTDKIGTEENLFRPPEIECRQEYDPFVENGFLNMYSIYGSAIKTSLRPLADGYTSMYQTLLSCTALDGKGDAATLEARKGAEYELWPGIVEPVMDTSFNPVNIEAIPAVEAELDFLVYTAWEIGQWRAEVDRRLNELFLASSGTSSNSLRKHFKAFRTLFRKRYTQIKACKYFQITLYNGSTLTWTSNALGEKPTYNIAGGYAKINGQNIYIYGITNVTAPFWAYVNIKFEDPDETTGQYKTVTASLVTSVDQLGNTETDYVIGIGGVVEVESDKKLSPKYKMYEIIQERCEIDEDIVRTASSGILEKLDDSTSPWGTRKTTKCNTLKATNSSEDDSSSQQP